MSSAQPSSQEAHHSFAVTCSAGALPLNFTANLSAPWTVLFGASGSGKSTLLRALCGLALKQSTTFTRSAGGQTADLSALPPERRSLAYAPQQAVLFPHLSVEGNLAFAQSVRGFRLPAHASQPEVQEILSLLDLEHLRDRKPHQLSGGERQRVSLGRALAVPRAALLLLDEPFAGVDRTQRDALLPRLRQWLASRELPVLSVTHDVDEALLLEAEVIRLGDGRNLAQGPARQVLAADIEQLYRLLQRP